MRCPVSRVLLTLGRLRSPSTRRLPALRRAALAATLALATLQTGCGAEDTTDARPDPDADNSLEPRTNACGGTALLSAEPGSVCGDCPTGRWQCLGLDDVACMGGEPNVCGGCGALPAAPGDPCGACSGTWQCGPDGELRCESVEPNACGGCEPLLGLPNFSCFDGILTCNGPNELVCRPGAGNACGGGEQLGVPPGRACGRCNNGRTACDGPNATQCLEPDLGSNACGGCETLAAAPGDACGCGGTWQCESEDQLVCVGGTPRNGCGGCAELPLEPGAPCEGGIGVCTTVDSLACAPAVNVCGGTRALAAQPGSTCGPCDDGVVVCEQADAVGCMGASLPNACGGCGRLPGIEGDVCGPARVWTCVGAQLRCAPAPERNACGGVAALDNAPGSPCGPCSSGLWICVSREDVACFGADSEQNRCGGCATLPIDAIPGAPCGTCFSGTWNCSGVDAIACVDDDPRRLRTWYADRDGDGVGDADTSRQRCEQPIGWTAQPGDCDDLEDRVAPGLPEFCDGLDNDCDGSIDEDWRAWPDADADGDGDQRQADAADVVVQCTLQPGFSRTATDCDDDDPRAAGTQTLGFTEPRSDGTFDFDCDGEEFAPNDRRGFCTSIGDCWGGFSTYSSGWLDEPRPRCGDEGAWLVRCERALARCEQIVEVRRQECR